MHAPITRTPTGALRILVVGIGSPHGDDQAGWLVAEQLADRVDPNHVLVRKAASPVELLAWIDGADRLIACDACRGPGNAGEVHRWTWPNRELLDAAWSGTHDLSLPAVLRLAERIGQLPDEVVVYAVEAAAVGPLNAASNQVLESIPTLASRIISETGVPARPRTSSSSLLSE